MIINCTVENQTLKTNFSKRLVSNSVNYLQVQTHFEEEADWENLTIYAEFSCNYENYLVEITPNFQDKIITVPAPAIKEPGFGLSFFGTAVKTSGDDTEITKRLTTNVIGFKVSPSGDLFGEFSDIDSGRVESWSKADQALRIAEELKSKMDPLLETVNTLLKEFEENLPKINAAATLKEEFESYKTQMSETVENIKVIISQTSEADRDFTTNSIADYDDSTITPIRSSIYSINNQLNSLLSLIKINQNSIIKINEEIDSLKERITITEEEIESLKERATSLEIFTTNLSAQITTILEDIATINATLTTHTFQLSSAENRITVLENKKISESDTTFITPTSLLIDYTSVAGTLNMETGEVEESETEKVTNEISIIGYTNYCSNLSGNKVCFYNSEKTFLSSLTVEGTSFLTPSGSAYIRICYPQNDNLLLEQGSTFTYDYLTEQFSARMEKGIKTIVDERYYNLITITLQQYY